MKTSLIAFLAGMSILMFSSLAFAGGEGCDSKKKGDKQMSNQAMKDFHKNHPWTSKDRMTLEQSSSKKDSGVKI